MIRKLRIKFVIINMVIVTAMICTIFGLVYHFTRTNLENESLGMMKQIADKPFMQNMPGEKMNRIMLPYFIVRTDVSGEILASESEFYDLSDEDFIENTVGLVLKSNSKSGILKDYSLRYLQVFNRGNQYIVFADISSEQATLNNLITTCIIIGFTSFAVFLVISFLLADWATRPVEKAWKQQRQFVADASHELKTPLTVILTNAELLQSQDYDEENRSRFSTGILTMANQMKNLIEDLLELARADNGSSKFDLSRFELSKLIEECEMNFEPVFFEKGLSLNSEIEPNIFINGDSGKMRQVVDILLDNAQKYSLSGSETRISLKKSGKNHCILCVCSSGEEIPADRLEKLFERFYRADEARIRNGSFGLGLSIAKSIISEHHGKIWAESKNGMNSFFTELPTA